jgi:hypothetical protein
VIVCKLEELQTTVTEYKAKTEALERKIAFLQQTNEDINDYLL